MKSVLIASLTAIVSFAGLALLSLQFFLALPQVFEVLGLSEGLSAVACAFGGPAQRPALPNPASRAFTIV